MSTPVKCNKYLVERMCEGRRYSTSRGRFGYDPKRKGYYSLDLPYLDSGVPLILEGCPFCFEELPSHFVYEASQKPEPPRLNPGDATAYDERDEEC